MFKNIMLSLTFVTVFLFTGCAKIQTTASMPDYQKKVENKKNIIIVPPMVKVFELSSSGQELMDEWTQTASSNMQASLKNFISNRYSSNYEVLNLDNLSDEQKKIIKDSNNLMYRVTPSIITHALDHSFVKFKDKQKNFDYKLGTDISKINKTDDLFLFINGADSVQTAGKKTVETVKLIVGALLGIGIGGNYGGQTFVAVSLVDGKSGDIVWHNYYTSQGADDLREQISSDKVIQGLLNELPKI